MSRIDIKKGVPPVPPDPERLTLYAATDETIHVLNSAGGDVILNTRQIGVSTAPAFTFVALAFSQTIAVESTGAGGKTIELPGASVLDGTRITVFDAATDATANPISITAGGGATIVGAGASPSDIVVDLGFRTYEFRGTVWFLVGRNG